MTILGATISTVWFIFLTIIWIAIAFWPATIAARKGRSFLLYFILSLFFWWITLFVVLFMRDESVHSSASAPAAKEDE